MVNQRIWWRMFIGVNSGGTQYNIVKWNIIINGSHLQNFDQITGKKSSMSHATTSCFGWSITHTHCLQLTLVVRINLFSCLSTPISSLCSISFLEFWSSSVFWVHHHHLDFNQSKSATTLNRPFLFNRTKSGHFTRCPKPHPSLTQKIQTKIRTKLAKYLNGY